MTQVPQDAFWSKAASEIYIFESIKKEMKWKKEKVLLTQSREGQRKLIPVTTRHIPINNR